MKKVFQMVLLCAVVLIGFSSCNKEITYTLTNQTGIEAEVFIQEYNEDDECINIKNAIFAGNESRAFTAAKDVVKIKLYSPDFEVWVQQVFYLEKDINITITASTVFGPSEP